MSKWDHLWINARLATMREGAGAYGAIENAAFADKDGRIVFAGPMRDLPGKPDTLATRVMEAQNQWITPGLIDCHTHLVFAGQRAAEHAARQRGDDYESIARAGGGIASTVSATKRSPKRAVASCRRYAQRAPPAKRRSSPKRKRVSARCSAKASPRSRSSPATAST
jgi:imidazolonepropionase